MSRWSDGAVQPDLDFTAAAQADPRIAFVVDLDGYEGPLHVLLALARTQKVDLLKLSIATLAEQYLAFVHEARRRDFALAGDYLVMASWLAYLKSRLLLPRDTRPEADGPPPEEMALALAFRLRKLEAMRSAVQALTDRPQLRRDVFPRGDPEATTVIPSDRIDASLYDLMRAYVAGRARGVAPTYAPAGRVEAYPLEAARDWLRAAPVLDRWTPLAEALPDDGAETPAASRLASTFAAGLELVKDGALTARQDAAFADLWLKRRSAVQAPA